MHFAQDQVQILSSRFWIEGSYRGDYEEGYNGAQSVEDQKPSKKPSPEQVALLTRSPEIGWMFLRNVAWMTTDVLFVAGYDDA
jgi:hypothetical protein